MTQKQIIQLYLKDLGDWQFEYKIRGIRTAHGFIGARGDRDVRQMISDGELDAGWSGKYRTVRYNSLKAPQESKSVSELSERELRLIVQ